MSIDEKREVAIFDLDGTITRGDTYVPFLLRCLRMRPWRLPYTVILPFAFLFYRVGLRDNGWLKKVFLKNIVGGIKRDVLDSEIKYFVADLINGGINPGALQVLSEHRIKGDYLVLASASLDIYVEPLGHYLGFDTILSTKVDRDGLRFSGNLDSSNCYGPEKLHLIRSLLNEDNKNIIAYSDHESDFELLRWVQRGVAVNPTDKLRQLALSHGIPVVDWRKL